MDVQIQPFKFMDLIIEQLLCYLGSIIQSTFLKYVHYLCALFHFISFHLYNISLTKFFSRGIKSVIHISYFYISGLGFFVTVIVGLLVGLVSGGRKQPVDGRYMSEYRVPGNNVFMLKAGKRDGDEMVGEPLMQKSIGGTTLESLERPRRGEPIRVPVQE